MSSHPIRSMFFRLWWAPIVCLGLGWLLGQTQAGWEFELRTLDWRTRARAKIQPPPDSRVMLVLFDDDAETNLVSWPPPRNYHGNLIELMSVAGLRVATMDVFLTSERDPETDGAMAAGVLAARERGTDVVTGAVSSEFEVMGAEQAESGPTAPITRIEGDLSRLMGNEFEVAPFPALRAASHYGFVDAQKETRNGIVRYLPLVVRIGQKLYPGLALQTLLRYYNVPAEAVWGTLGEALYIDTPQRRIRIPMDLRGRALVNYRYEIEGPPTGFETVSYRSLLLGLHSRYVEPLADVQPPPLLRGRVAVIGLFTTGNADAGPSPFSAFAPLPLVHANLIHNVLADDFATVAPAGWVWGLALLAGWVGMALAAGRSANVLTVATLVGLAGYAAAAFGFWATHSVWLPFVGPLVGFALLQFVLIARRIIEEQQAKQAIKGMFGSYVAPEVVERLVRGDDKPQLGGHLVDITAYFSDIQGFSTFSEVLPPDRLVELMNEYLTACTDIVVDERGTLDKYIGDAVVAMFGAPIAQNDHAYRACVAALRVQERVGELRAKWAAEGDRWPGLVREMRTRIGLNTGTCIVGNMGSRTRFNYTMMGDDVNLAARMESGAKHWGTYILCTEATKQACDAHGGGRVVFRPLGRIVVKGRSRPVPIHEIVGLRKSLPAQTLECLSVFADGMARYEARDWAGALACFERSEALEPLRPGLAAGVASNPSLVYQSITRHYADVPPPPDWDGVYHMHEK